MRTSELLSLEIIGLCGTSSANLEDLVDQVEALIIARDTLKSMYADQDARRAEAPIAAAQVQP